MGDQSNNTAGGSVALTLWCSGKQARTLLPDITFLSSSSSLFCMRNFSLCVSPGSWRDVVRNKTSNSTTSNNMFTGMTDYLNISETILVQKPAINVVWQCILQNGLDVYLDSVFVMIEILIYAWKKIQISNVIQYIYSRN